MQLKTLQNKVVKIVGGGNHQNRVTPFYLKLGTGILKVEDLVLFEKALFCIQT